jgi:peptidoglycan/xylan/chitin deacetylase (PgdA/CDA1 family)
MPIWISRRLIVVVLLGLGLAPVARAEVIEQLPTHDKVVALTFDACETRTPSFLDTSISDYLVGHKVPFTVFVSGRFAKHNAEALSNLAKLDFVEIENHSLNHDNHMERLDSAAVTREVTENDALLSSITGRHTRYFRFPAGNYGPRSLADVEGLGYKVVHWSFASGDPAKSLTPEALRNWVLFKTKPGNILIFHINGRGWSTGAALPGIIDDLTRRGYRFTTLDQMLP